jgi:hypothetical protein
MAIERDMVMRRGMRSWMEAGGREEVGPVASASPAARPRADQVFQQIVAVWAGLFVRQAERSYGGQREA